MPNIAGLCHRWKHGDFRLFLRRDHERASLLLPPLVDEEVLGGCIQERKVVEFLHVEPLEHADLELLGEVGGVLGVLRQAEETAVERAAMEVHGGVEGF